MIVETQKNPAWRRCAPQSAAFSGHNDGGRKRLPFGIREVDNHLPIGSPALDEAAMTPDTVPPPISSALALPYAFSVC